MYYVSQRPIYSCTNDVERALWLAALAPGDVILTMHAGLAVSHVTWFQNQFQQYPPQARSFTHAAIYVGASRVVHATAELGALLPTAGAVQDVGVWDVVTEGVFFVCLRAPEIDPSLRDVLAQAARGYLGAPYDFVGIGRAIAYCLFGEPFGRAVRMLRGVREPEFVARSFASAEAYICSELVASVYDEVLQKKNPCNIPGGRPAGIALPCEFFVNPRFESVLPPGR